MIFICLQTAMIVHSSDYLVRPQPQPVLQALLPWAGSSSVLILLTYQIFCDKVESNRIVLGAGPGGGNGQQPQEPQATSASDDRLLYATSAIGYLASSVYLVMFLILVIHEFAVGWDCCPNKKKGQPLRQASLRARLNSEPLPRSFLLMTLLSCPSPPTNR